MRTKPLRPQWLALGDKPAGLAGPGLEIGCTERLSRSPTSGTFARQGASMMAHRVPEGAVFVLERGGQAQAVPAVGGPTVTLAPPQKHVCRRWPSAVVGWNSSERE